MTENIGRFRIQVVSELTGVPSPTLRAWERRYGIPTPARTSSAYRLYSDHDVAMVRRMRDLCANGMSIAEAARMVKAAPDGGAVLEDVESDPYTVAVRRIFDAVQAFDARAVEREAARALYLGPATSVYERVFSPVMRRVGECWREGSLSIAQEHITSTVIGDLIRGLVRLTNPEDADRTVLLACFADEEHALPIYGVALRLASWGVGTITLGTRTPPSAIADAVRHMHPNAVGLSLTMPLDAPRAQRLMSAYAEACADVPWFVGGSGVEPMADLIAHHGGFVIEGDLNASRTHLERMLRSRSDVNDSVSASHSIATH